VNTAIDLSGLSLDKIEEIPKDAPEVTTDNGAPGMPDGIREAADGRGGYRIGAMATLRQLEKHEGLNRLTDGAIKDCVRDIVGVQFRNLATVGGSLFGRFGFSDVLTLFMAAGAKLELYHGGIVTVEEFARMPFDRDILTHVIFPGKEQRIAWQSFRNARTDFSVLNCCVSIEEKETRCCVGARPMKAVCLRDEQGILKDGITQESARAFGRYVKENVKTGSNLRGSGEYRSMLAETLGKRALLSAAESLADKR
ncbi:MAG: FAD binding domain-containing protein, partial [Lachnospiraceae bacterium]|nr:FAD binding domain-containing protein [Lachnospiraceae bacterium]